MGFQMVFRESISYEKLYQKLQFRNKIVFFYFFLPLRRIKGVPDT